ncbi:MAG TPA: nucleoside 2-deoxyribosyltransferase [Xanthobacteraceae bacterium]|jgi:nucleoside 2-deoxyribosyltransferase|nr:nucleoside 2-deoxyribosyltransferase [Xanthobacteraceae bacterium]
MKIYLAGPLGFSEAGRAFHEKAVVPTIRRLGHIGLDPWSATNPLGIEPGLAAEVAAVTKMPFGEGRRDAWRKLNLRIGAKNQGLIDGCDLVFAVLDGADVDSGTAAEIGYAFAKGKPTVGYRGDFRVTADNDGSILNLQVEYFIYASGGTIITQIDELATALAAVKVA